MSENKPVKTREGSAAQVQSEAASTIRPAVDIFEDASGITIKADLPGVSADRLDVKVEGNTLTIEGQASIDVPEGMEALRADLVSSHFRRSFTLSNELETDKIRAEVRDGVLTLHLPKRPELQPRKIEVTTA